jgi:hypothetical protein
VKRIKSERLAGVLCLILGALSYAVDCWVGSSVCPGKPFLMSGPCAGTWFIMTAGVIGIGLWYLVFGKS